MEHHLPILRGAIKKNWFFLCFPEKGGGEDLVESKISLTEKTEIFLDFFAKRGLAENWAKYPKNRIFFNISPKTGVFLDIFS